MRTFVSGFYIGTDIDETLAFLRPFPLRMPIENTIISKAETGG
jgi:hypothetical protein